MRLIKELYKEKIKTFDFMSHVYQLDGVHALLQTGCNGTSTGRDQFFRSSRNCWAFLRCLVTAHSCWRVGKWACKVIRRLTCQSVENSRGVRFWSNKRRNID